MNMDLAKRLVELRVYNDMSQDELSVKTDISKKDIEKWESGKDSPDGEQLIKLSQIYSMTIDEILLNFDTDSEQTPTTVSNNTVYETPKNKKSYNWYAFPYPIIALGVYLALGLIFNMWHPTWMIFLTIPVYYMMITFKISENNYNWYVFPYPIIILILYLALGFDYGIWHPSWLLFLTIPVYYMVIAWLDGEKK